MSKLLKLLGKLARVLLAIEPQKWSEAPSIKIQALAGGEHLPLDAKVVIPEKHAAPIVEQGMVVIPAAAPNTVITPVPEPYSWKLTARKALEQVAVVLWAFVAWAGVYALDGILAGGVLEKLHLPPWVSVPMVYGALNALRDHVRRKHNEEQRAR